jgi:plastocyanin
VNHSIGRQVVVLIVLVLLLIAVGIFSSLTNGIHPRGFSDADTAQQVPPPPPRTEHMEKVLSESRGFSQFVSYTDNGFEPADVTVSKGETVRFTNNSAHDLWIMASGGDGGVYPATGNNCGQSDFDTCIALPPNEIWEFTFTAAGTWVYRNNVDKDHVGVIRVK